MRINLKVPFAEKDFARRAGARWDLARRVWFIEDVEDLTPFMSWIDAPLKTVHQLTPADKKGIERKKLTGKAVARYVRQKKQKKLAKKSAANSQS